MTKRPRRQLKVTMSPKAEAAKQEFRNCDAPEGCPNIISVADKPSGYSGPVYCVLHREKPK